MDKKHKGFSVAQLMMILLVVSITLAASMPIITRKFKVAVKPAEHGMWACIKVPVGDTGETKLMQYKNPESNAGIPSINPLDPDWIEDCQLPTFPETVQYIFVTLIGGGAAGQAPTIEVLPPGKVTYLNQPQTVASGQGSNPPTVVDISGNYEITFTGLTGDMLGLTYKPQSTVLPFEFYARKKEGNYNFALRRYEFYYADKVQCDANYYNNGQPGKPATLVFKMFLNQGDKLSLSYQQRGGRAGELTNPEDLCQDVTEGIQCGGIADIDFDRNTGDCILGDNKNLSSLNSKQYGFWDASTILWHMDNVSGKINKDLYSGLGINSAAGFLMQNDGLEPVLQFKYTRPAGTTIQTPKDGLAVLLLHQAAKERKESTVAMINGAVKSYWYGNDYEDKVPKCSLASCYRYVSFPPEQFIYMDIDPCKAAGYTPDTTDKKGNKVYKFPTPLEALINGCTTGKLSDGSDRTKFGIDSAYAAGVFKQIAESPDQSRKYTAVAEGGQETKVKGGFLGLFEPRDPLGNTIKLLDPVSLFTAGCGGAAGSSLTTVVSLLGIDKIDIKKDNIGDPGVPPPAGSKNGERGGDLAADGKTVLGKAPTGTSFLGLVAPGGSPNICGDGKNVPRREFDGSLSFASFGGSAFTDNPDNSIGGKGGIFGKWEVSTKGENIPKTDTSKLAGTATTPAAVAPTQGSGVGAGGGGGIARQKLDETGALWFKDDVPQYEIIQGAPGTGGAIIITW